MFGAKGLAIKLADGLDAAANDFEKSSLEVIRKIDEGSDRALAMQAHGFVTTAMTLRAVAAVVRSVVE